MKIQASLRLQAFLSHDPNEALPFLKALGCKVDPVPLDHTKYSYNFQVSEGTDIEAMTRKISSKIFSKIEVVPNITKIRLLKKLQIHTSWTMTSEITLSLIGLNIGLPDERYYFKLADKSYTSVADFATMTKIFK